MSDREAIIKHGQLLNLVGTPRYSKEFLFVGAWVDIDEPESGTSKYELSAFLRRFPSAPAGWPFAWDGYFQFRECGDDCWVRSRLQRIFGFTPGCINGDWTRTLDVAFLAIERYAPNQPWIAYPFACSNDMGEYDGTSPVGLYFSRHGPDAETRLRIADAFWALLIEQPADLGDWELIRRVVSDGSFEIWRSGHGRDGFFNDANYFQSDPGEMDNHLGFVYGDWQPCIDCDGTGVEFWFPYTDDCATCGGTGRITW